MEGPGQTPESALSLRDLEARITELAGHLNAANHRWLRLIAEFDRRQGWSDGYTRSCAHWLQWKCGLDLGAAREKVRVARALEGLPGIDAAMGRGELSYSKVRALTRVASTATEEVLLNVALHGTTHHVETLVRQFRRVQEVEELSREARQHANRRLTYYHDEDGSLVLKVQLPAETGALVIEALEAALSDVPLPNDCEPALHVSAETSFAVAGAQPTAATRRADALVVLAESFLQHGAEALSGGDRHQIVLHVDECTLKHRAAGRCELEDGPAAPIETARRIACDASVVEIVEDERGEPLDVGRKTRTIPPCAATRAEITRSRLRLPGLHAQALRGRASHPALGRWRRHQVVEPGVVVPLPSPRRARGRAARRAHRRWRVAILQARWRVDRVLRAGAYAAAWGLDAVGRCECREWREYRCQDGCDPVEGRADGLRDRD